jgi:hypothetical protein
MCLKNANDFSVAFKPKQAFYKEEFSDTFTVTENSFLLLYRDRLFRSGYFYARSDKINICNNFFAKSYFFIDFY